MQFPSVSAREAEPQHAAAAEVAGASYVELDGPLSFDLDTPEDLLDADSRVSIMRQAGERPFGRQGRA